MAPLRGCCPVFGCRDEQVCRDKTICTHLKLPFRVARTPQRVRRCCWWRCLVNNHNTRLGGEDGAWRRGVFDTTTTARLEQSCCLPRGTSLVEFVPTMSWTGFSGCDESLSNKPRTKMKRRVMLFKLVITPKVNTRGRTTMFGPTQHNASNVATQSILSTTLVSCVAARWGITAGCSVRAVSTPLLTGGMTATESDSANEAPHDTGR